MQGGVAVVILYERACAKVAREEGHLISQWQENEAIQKLEGMYAKENEVGQEAPRRMLIGKAD